MLTLSAVPFIPSSPITGGESLAAYRAKNLKLRGQPGRMYWEVYSGSEDLNEPIPTTQLTGTVSFSPSSLTVTGTGTAFLDELHIGQMILADTEVLVVSAITSDTEFINARPILSTETNVTADKMPVIFPLNTNRGTLYHGNGVFFDKGTIVAVGDGVLRVNGSVLPGDSLTATRRAQVALYDAATQTYDVQDLGFDTVPTLANTAITVVASGGTKNMSLGYYSFMVAYYSTESGGFGNATNVLLASGTTGYQLTVANSTFRLNKSGDTPPAKADGYIIYGSAYGGSSANSQINAIQGPWYQIGNPVPFSAFTADEYTFEYVDADLSTLVSFDNDAPDDAEFCANLTGYLALVSTNGQGVGNGAREASTSPGPYVSPMKADNIDSYPDTSKVPTEKGEIITGLLSAAGRLFVLTPNSLQAVTPTGLPSVPFTCRPFWKRGFQGVYNLAFVDDTLYGFTTAGMFRSIATGDEGSESHVFASDVEAQTAEWYGGYVFVEHDAKNEEVCFIYSASRLNDEGYWESDIYPYSLRQQAWQPPVVLSSPERDMIVSGVASVNGHLEFTAGGRRSGDTNQYDTWRYDTGSGLAVPWYIAWNYIDNGAEITAKAIRKLRPKGKFTVSNVQVYAVTPDTEIDVADLETGDNPAFEVLLDSSTEVKQYEVTKCRVRNAMMWTARIDGVWDGFGIKDQVHELAVELDVYGQMR